MEQLALQQAAHDQNRQLRQTAQQLINEAYLQQQHNSRAKRGLDSEEATRLLDEAFPLVQHRHSAPASPPSDSVQSVPVVQSDSKEASRSKSRKSKTQKTALEKLLSGGSLTGLPPPHNHSLSRNAAPSPNSATRNAWEESTRSQPLPSSATRPHESNVRSAAEVISRGLNSLSPQEKKVLLQAIRTELQAMQPPSEDS